MKQYSAKDLITRAKAGLILDQPFFATLLLRMDIVERKNDPKVQRMATNGTVIEYNPEWVETLTLEQCKGTMCQAVMHCVLQHHTRRQHRNAKRWNKASDLVVNPILMEAKMELPPSDTNTNTHAGKVVEEVYNLLPEEDESPPPKGKGGSGNGEGKQDPNGDCCGVNDAPNENNPNAPPSESDMRRSEEEWKIATAQAQEVAKSVGKLPGYLERMIGDILEPKLDWKSILRRFIESSIKSDYQWYPPNRRFIHMGLYLPSVKNEDTISVAIAIDTSGSIGQRELDEFASEVSAILAEFKCSCDIIYCDAAVQSVQHVEYYDLPLRLKPKGGGGTAFEPVIEHLDNMPKDQRPHCLIYFTDLYGSFPKNAPEYPVLWAVLNGSKQDPPFGERLDIC